jgi:hypothetical protein
MQPDGVGVGDGVGDGVILGTQRLFWQIPSLYKQACIIAGHGLSTGHGGCVGQTFVLHLDPFGEQLTGVVVVVGQIRVVGHGALTH